MHLSEQQWKNEICAFFHHQADQVQPDYIVAVKGLARKLLPVQAHGVFWALQTIHGVQMSLFMAHVMGIGKTTQAFAIHHIQHILNIMYADIRASPHNHSKAGGQCPSNAQMYQKYGFDCPCWPGSPSSFVKERLGCTIMMVPTGLLEVWVHEFNACSPQTPDERRVRLAVAHRSGEISSKEWKLLCGDEEERRNDKGEPAASVFTPRLDNGWVIVLTTPDSAVSHFLEHATNQRRKSWDHQPPGAPAVNRQGQRYITKPKTVRMFSHSYQACIISLIVKDEAHLRKAPAVKAIASCISRQAKGRLIALLLLSGTPLTNGPSDLAGLVALMRNPQWKQHEVLKQWRGGELEQLGAEWAKYCRTSKKANKEYVDQVIHRFTPLVETLMLRMTTTSDFFGCSPVRVPENLYLEQRCTHPDTWRKASNLIYESEAQNFQLRNAKRLQLYTEKHGSGEGYIPLSNTSANLYYRSRLCASFPYLQHLVDEQNSPLRLTESEWMRHKNGVDNAKKWKARTAGHDPYYDNLERIVESSGKLTEIKKIVKEFSAFRDGENKLARSIFCSYFYTGAYLMYLVCSPCAARMVGGS